MALRSIGFKVGGASTSSSSNHKAGRSPYFPISPHTMDRQPPNPDYTTHRQS